MEIYKLSEDLNLVLESIKENIFDKNNPDLFKDLYHELTDAGDFYFYLAYTTMIILNAIKRLISYTKINLNGLKNHY